MNFASIRSVFVLKSGSMTNAILLRIPADQRGPLAPLDALAAIPEEEIWLAKQKSPQTRRAYRLDVRHFTRAVGITTTEAAPGRSPRHHRLGTDAARAGRCCVFDRAPPYGGPVQSVQDGAANRNPLVDVERKYAAEIGLARGYSAHSMRATFITTALENGAQLEDVQKAAGHRDPSTTKLYDRRGYNPKKAASFFATY
jgi:Phage integrase family